MVDFLNKLYSYQYFGLYLIISIIVLVILFIIILFFGKKDQKVREIEATKKLQQINSDAFKEESEIQKVEVSKQNEELLNDTIIVPTINNEGDVMKTVEEDKEEIIEPILPSVEDIKPLEFNEETKEEIVSVNNEVEVKKEDTLVNETEEVITPLLDKIEEKPFIFSDVSENIEHIEEVEVPKIEQVSEEINKEETVVEVPTFNFDEIVKDVNLEKEEIKEVKRPEIFSSVYVPKKEEEKEEIKEENELDFEMPKLKEEAEKVNDMPVLNNYNLDSISLETYDINK